MESETPRKREQHTKEGAMEWKILRGDNVMIIRGKDEGETGIIKRVIRSQKRVIVEGKNLWGTKTHLWMSCLKEP